MSSAAAPIAPENELEERVAPVLSDELYWFPVRHHSPVAAHFVSKVIARRKPRCLLLEVSTHLQHLLPFLLSKTRPPVALYSSARDDTGCAAGRAGTSWYPLLEYSPEWQAIQAANKIGADIRFIDLPHYYQPDDNGSAASDSAVFFQSLADQAGYLNWHECWDALFEQALDGKSTAADQEKLRQQLVYFSAAARFHGTAVESEAMLARECYMWGNIKHALQDYTAQETMVVCGALHLHMARDDSGYSSLCAGLSDVEKQLTLNTTIVPYSYRRISLQSGYAAGNRAPWFYYQLWRNKGKPQKRLLEHIRAVLAAARKSGQSVSAADNLAVAHHAVLLAQLRNRESPLLDDIEDAVWACCCKGDPAEQGARLAKAISQVNTGARIGTVNPDLGQLPLVSDFYAQLALLDLEQPSMDESRTVKCDLRTADGLARSQFLHRLKFLELPCANESAHTRSSQAKLFSENWTLKALGSEEALIEYSEYGDTIDTVVHARVESLIEQQLSDIDKLASTLSKSQVMGLGVFNDDIASHFRDGLQRSGNFNTLARVFQKLLRIRNQQKFLDAIEPSTDPLLVLCFLRASLCLGRLGDVPAEDQKDFVSGLRVLAEAWLSMKELPLDRQIFEQELTSVTSRHHQSSLVHGCCFGLLLESGRYTLDNFSSQLATFTGYGSGDSLVQAAIWLEGVMYTTKVSILSGAEVFCQAVDKLLRQASQDDFLIILPRLRAGMEALPRIQRDALASGVANLYGLASTDAVRQRPTAAIVQNLGAIDSEVQQIMLKWGLVS